MLEESALKDRLMTRLRTVDTKKKKAFPKVGDWHGANAYGIYGDKYRDLFLKSLDGDEDSGRKASKFRTLAKVGGLATCYGAMPKTLAGRMAIPMEDAEYFYTNFFKSFPVFKKYMDAFISNTRKKCQVSDLFGRIRYLPVLGRRPTGNEEEDAKLNRQKWGSINVAYNAPVQGSGATMLKYMLIQLGRYIERGRLNRFHGNLAATYRPYTRIVGMDADAATDDFRSFVDGLECGNIKVLLLKNGVVVEEYSRPVRMSKRDIDRYGMDLLW